VNVFKKTAILVALAAAAAGAQAASPTVYGVADIGYTYTKLGDLSVSTLDSSGKSDSFIGFKASENIAPGLKAIVTLEAGYNLDTGATEDNLFSREASIGIVSGAHTIKAGRLESLSYAAVKKFDVFGGGNLGTTRLTGNVAEYNSNTVGYAVNHGNFNFGAQHTFGEMVEGGLRNSSTDAVSIGYDRGPVSASVVHTNTDDGYATIGERTTQVAGAYDFGGAKASVIAQNASGQATGLDKSVVVGVSAPVNRFVAMASVGQAKLVDGSKVDLYSVGGTYNLSKRTAVYAAVGRVDVQVAAADKFAMGINHAF
jgi:predicted porin